MAEVSKTAKQAIHAGAGIKKLVAMAWVFQRKVGKMQTKPYLTFYSTEAAESFMETHSEDEFHLVKKEEKARRK